MPNLTLEQHIIAEGCRRIFLDTGFARELAATFHISLEEVAGQVNVIQRRIGVPVWGNPSVKPLVAIENIEKGQPVAIGNGEACVANPDDDPRHHHCKTCSGFPIAIVCDKQCDKTCEHWTE